MILKNIKLKKHIFILKEFVKNVGKETSGEVEEKDKDNEFMDDFEKTPDLWLSITEYSHFKNISVSTIRRYIKKKKIKYRDIRGKYYIYVEKEQTPYDLKHSDTLNFYIGENELLKEKLKKSQEEIDELNMLVSIYENKKRNINH